MRDVFGAPYPMIEDPAMDASLMGSGQDPSQAALLQILAKIQTLQRRAAGPQNWLQGLGTALQGFASGYKNEPNPAIQQALQERGQDMQGLHHALQAHLGLANFGLDQQKLGLSQKMEERRIQSEAARGEREGWAERFKIRSELVKGMLTLAKDNPLLGGKALAEMERMYKEQGIPLPPGGFTVSGLENVAKKGKEIGMAVLGGLSDDKIALGVGVPIESVQTIRTTMSTPGPNRDMFMKSTLGHTYAELAKDQAQIENLTADIKKKNFDIGLRQQELNLMAKPVRTPDQERELNAIREHGKTPDETRDLTRTLMETERLPFELAATKATRIIAEAKNQSDFKDVVRAIREKNPQLSQGEAVLAANAQVKASKSDFSALETQMDTMKDFLSRLKEYSSQVNTFNLPMVQGIAGVIRYGGSYVRADVALAGLQRKQGELAGVMRFLGEKGVISDLDVQRGMLLLPSVMTSGPVARDSIRELETIVSRGEKALERRRQSATSIQGSQPSTDPHDPLGIRSR